MNLSEVNHDPNTLALARRLSKPIIIFDLEHTGSAGEHRCITDFGAILVTPDGDISTYASLVKPPKGTQFNPIVCRLTGIFPHTVEDASGWENALHEFVLRNQSVLWVGFSSRSSDTPIVYKETLDDEIPYKPQAHSFRAVYNLRKRHATKRGVRPTRPD